tara:strand:+ start:3157 stop:4305 length:1149 start_codon:yes stop_codon:yes gene_type:complete
MAYNVLKGAVEGSVDQHGDQEIDGIKVFKNVVSASVFYDTDAQSPCATENKVAVERIVSEKAGAILTYQGNKKAQCHYNLLFDGRTLHTDNAVISRITGSGCGLRDLPADKLLGVVPAHSINYGSGLEEYKHKLRVNAGEGISVNSDGTSVALLPNGGLGTKSRKLTLDPENALNIKENGQNLSDPDLLLVYDATRREIRYTTMQNLYDGFLNFKVPHPGGSKNSIQFKGAKEFDGNSNFTFEPQNSTATLKGTFRSLALHVSKKIQSNGDLEINGALYKNVKVTSDVNYDFQDTDNTVLFDTTDANIVATLPPAKKNPGRVITVKKICENKYKLISSYHLKIKSDGGKIDFSSEITLKSNYSVRTFHSDGSSWWVINKSGT